MKLLTKKIHTNQTINTIMKTLLKTLTLVHVITCLFIQAQTKTPTTKLEDFLGNYDGFTPPNKVEIKIGDYDDYAKFALVKKDDNTVIKTDGFFEETFNFKDGVLIKSNFANTEKLYFKYFPKLKKKLLVQEFDGRYTDDNLFMKTKKQLKK